MLFFYCAVVRGDKVLCDYATQEAGNCDTFILSLLSHFPQYKTRVTYFKDDQPMVHVLVEIPFTYLCITDESFPKEKAHLFLLEIKRRFCASSSYPRAQYANAFELRREFSPILMAEMSYFSNNQPEDKAMEITGIVTENIEKILQGSKHLKILLKRSSHLNSTGSRQQPKMWCKKVRIYGIWLSLY